MEQNNSQATDALGNPIVEGKFYGYTRSHNGIYINRRVLVKEIGFTKARSNHDYPIVKGLACDNGMLVGGLDRGYNGPIGKVARVTIQGVNTLWPISQEDAKKDHCCQAIFESEANKYYK